MAGSKRNFSTVAKTWSENTSLDEIENEDVNCQKKRKNVVVASDQKKVKRVHDLIMILKKFFPNIFNKDQVLATIVSKFLEDLSNIENLIENNEDYEGNIDYVIQAKKTGNKLKYVTTINSGGLLDNIGETAVEKYFNQYTSYYKQNFTEIESLGSGSFGAVYKAISKLDKVEYAIKKIKIKSDNKKEIRHSVDEVKTLAQLYHPNIIKYKHAWVELEPLEGNDFQSLSQSSESDDSNRDYSSTNGLTTDMRICTLNSSQDQRISEGESSQDSLNIEAGKIFTLYIKMTLSAMNLRQWIDNRDEPSDESTIRNITKQVLHGLAYIHHLKIVHHDINPHNILITLQPNGEIQAEIGDFGLACCLKKKNHSEIGGTRPYCAPEQLQNKCDPKSDVYSFGIVLFELLYPMQTGYERSVTLEKLKTRNVIPLSIINNYPHWDKILRKAICVDPKIRASADQLLYFITQKEKLDEKNQSCKNPFCLAKMNQNQ